MHTCTSPSDTPLLEVIESVIVPLCTFVFSCLGLQLSIVKFPFKWPTCQVIILYEYIFVYFNICFRFDYPVHVHSMQGGSCSLRLTVGSVADLVRTSVLRTRRRLRRGAYYRARKQAQLQQQQKSRVKIATRQVKTVVRSSLHHQHRQPRFCQRLQQAFPRSLCQCFHLQQDFIKWLSVSVVCLFAVVCAFMNFNYRF